MKQDMEKWLVSFRCMHRTKQVNWLKAYALKHWHRNKHMTTDAFILEYAGRMAFFLDAKKRNEACQIAMRIAQECCAGKYEPSPAYRGFHAQKGMKERVGGARRSEIEPYVAPEYAKNDGDVHDIELVEAE
jgi:hypothetical protein